MPVLTPAFLFIPFPDCVKNYTFTKITTFYSKFSFQLSTFKLSLKMCHISEDEINTGFHY